MFRYRLAELQEWLSWTSLPAEGNQPGSLLAQGSLAIPTCWNIGSSWKVLPQVGETSHLCPGH